MNCKNVSMVIIRNKYIKIKKLLRYFYYILEQIIDKCNEFYLFSPYKRVIQHFHCYFTTILHIFFVKMYEELHEI